MSPVRKCKLFAALGMTRLAMLRAGAVMFLLVAPLLPGAVHAQEASESFARRHAELLRAAETQLAQLRAPGSDAAGQPLVTGGEARTAPASATRARPLANIAEERVERARRKLLALGVDAARVFAEEGVPLALVVVAEVESGFDPAAVSRKGARGLWQFMPETARRYDLRVDGRIDERLHAARSTRAAARYLRDLHLLFGDWRLALAAYNAGEARVAGALERVEGREFADVLDHLPHETREYVPAVLGGLRREPAP